MRNKIFALLLISLLLASCASTSEITPIGKDTYILANSGAANADAFDEFKENLRIFMPLAEQGDSEAQFFVGFTYEHSQGVPPDYIQAAKWYHKAAEQGYAEAQLYLGNIYANGRGVPQDYTQAAKWYRKAAEQGHDVAQYNLGVMHFYGRGLPQDYTQTAKWYRKAAEQGYAEAQFNLGVMCFLGRGVPQDYVQAHTWINLAAVGGNSKYVELRNQLASEMTPSQIAEAQKLAREWRPKK